MMASLCIPPTRYSRTRGLSTASAKAVDGSRPNDRARPGTDTAMSTTPASATSRKPSAVVKTLWVRWAFTHAMSKKTGPYGAWACCHRGSTRSKNAEPRTGPSPWV